MRAIEFRASLALSVLVAGASAQAQLVWRRLPQGADHDVAMVFDSWRQRFVLQGDRTWEWDGADWRERRTAHQPGPFATIGLAFDRSRGRTILYGGMAYAATAELWEYDGLDWTQRSLVAGPPTRFFPAIGYDSLRQRVVLFGGYSTVNNSALGDTWTWDGANWAAVPGPGPRPGPAAMAFHSTSGRMVLFGGPASGTLGETWTFDGVSWQLEQPANRPAARGSDHRMCEDSTHGVVRMIGGADSLAWEWNGLDWSAAPALMGRRARPAFASDGSSTTLLRGGVESAVLISFSPVSLSDTWRLQSGSWTRVHGTGPAATSTAGSADVTLTCDLTRGDTLCTVLANNERRTYRWSNGEWAENAGARLPSLFGARACHDLFRGRYVMFGGGTSGLSFTSPAPTASLFEYDGVAWSANSAPGPSPRSKHSFAFDVVNGEALLFGGSTGSSDLGDTWLWNGFRWRLVATTGPSPRSCAAATADLLHAAVVLFGGFLSNSTSLADTWTWNGTSWQQVATAVRPPARFDAGFDFDYVRRRAVLVGGKTGAVTSYSDVWEWDGTTWAQRGGGMAENLSLTQSSSIASAGAGMLRVVGKDTWFGSSAAAAVDTLGAGCGNPVPVLVALGEPVLGSQTFAVEVHRAPANAPFVVGVGTGPTPLALGSGCTLQLQTIDYSAIGLASPTGFAVATLPIPGTPALRGLSAVVQAAVVQPAAPLGFALTNGLLGRVGD